MKGRIALVQIFDTGFLQHQHDKCRILFKKNKKNKIKSTKKNKKNYKDLFDAGSVAEHADGQVSDFIKRMLPNHNKN